MAGVKYVDLVGKHAPLRDRLIAALDQVLAHGQFVMGPEVAELEAELAGYLGVPEVVTCNSGTDALLLAMKMRGIGVGDEVITTAHSFVATGNAILLAGATPVFVDIDETSMVLDPGLVRAALTERTRAVIVVHLNGYPVDTGPFRTLCGEHGLSLLEDCAQAFGSRRGEVGVGNVDVGCFSFHPLKLFSACGDGGCVTVQNSEDASRLRELRNHGLVDRDTSVRAGFNSRLDTIQAGFLLAKIDLVDGWIEARQTRAKRYRDALEGLVRLPPSDTDIRCNYSCFAVRLPHRERVREALVAAGVDVKVHYPLAIHQQPTFAPYQRHALPVTERVVSEILSLPISEELSLAQQDQVISALRANVEPAS